MNRPKNNKIRRPQFLCIVGCEGKNQERIYFDKVAELVNCVEERTHDLVFDYIARLAKATREDELLKAGLSPRGTVALAGMSRALAWMDKRNYVIPQDVSNAFEPVALHRITLSTKAKVGNVKKESITKKIVAQVKVPIVRNK